MMRSFRQQEDHILKRERNKEKEYRRQREKERERERARYKKLEKQMEMTQEEEQRRIKKFLTPERMKQVQKEELEDILAIEEEHPPEPEEDEPIEAKKKSKFYLGEKVEIQRGQNTGEDKFKVELQGHEMEIEDQ